METYEVYFAEDGCDSEWDLLGKMESDSLSHAQEQSIKQWQDYPSKYLVVCPCSAKRDCVPVYYNTNAVSTQ